MTDPLPVTVLLADGDNDRRSAVAQALRLAGFQVREVGTAADCLARAAEGTDLVLISGPLPDFAAGALRSRLQDQPRTATIAVLWLLPPEANGDAPPNSADGYLIIPVQPVELASMARALVQARRVERELRESQERFRQLREEFRQAQKMEAIGRLAGGVAHDFNNVLTAITGYSELIMLDAASPADPSYRHAEEVRRAAERAAALARQLLAYSRPQVLTPRVLNLNTVVTDLEKMLRRLIHETVALKLDLDPRLRRVEADPGQIEQVLMNLCVNACDAMPTGGELTIRSRNVELDDAYAWGQVDVRPGAYVLLAVTDSGCGMSEEVRRHLFEPFFTTKEVGKGTGLGLSTVAGIIKQSGGHITVESAPGRGSTFKVYLPQVMEFAKPDGSAGAATRPVPGSETVLLVEDEEVVRSLARTVLQRSGYRVLEARDGLEALEISRRHDGPIHLLLTDVVMPRLNGRDLAQQLAQHRPTTRVLYMSGYTGFVSDPLDLPGIVAAFLQKPFAPAALAQQVRLLLDK